MGTILRCAVALGLAAGLGLPASAQGERCTQEQFALDGIRIGARFCVPAGPPAAGVVVSETFSALGKTLTKTTPLAVVPGAQVSRTIDDVDLSPIGSKHSLHMTLAYHDGAVALEHALALPGAIPVK